MYAGRKGRRENTNSLDILIGYWISSLPNAIPFGPTDLDIFSVAKRQVFEKFPTFREELRNHNALLFSNFVIVSYDDARKKPVVSIADTAAVQTKSNYTGFAK